MPELPEVETVVRGLRPDLVQRRICGMWFDWARIIHTPSPELFEAQINGQQIQSVRRRAKYILIELESDLLVVHLKMTGRLYVVPPESTQEADRWVHVKFMLDDGRELRFSDSRKFGRVYLVDDLTQITGTLGPEPLEDDFTLEIFQQQLGGRSRAMKALLLDQTRIAGVGNIYADEALHRARIHPLRPANSLNPDEWERLYHAVRAALFDGVAYQGASIQWYRKADGSKGSSQDHFYVYGRTGQACSTCGSPIEKIRVAQRGTHFCPNCQPLEKGAIAHV